MRFRVKPGWRGKQMKRFNTLAFFILLFVTVTSASTGKSNFATIGEDKVHYLEFGKKSDDALIFVHGWTCDSEFWSENTKAFQGKRVIAVDLPGHGRSDAPKLEYTMNHFADSIDAVMRHAKIKRAVLVGHSMGTPVVRQFYRRYPKKTLGLVVVDGMLRGFPNRELIDQFVKSFENNYENASKLFIGEMVKPMKDSKKAAFVVKKMHSTKQHVAASAFKNMFDEKVWKDEEKINVPLLVVLAPSQNRLPGVEEYVKKSAKISEFHLWNDVSHFLMMDEPKRFNQTLTKFLSNHELLR